MPRVAIRQRPAPAPARPSPGIAPPTRTAPTVLVPFAPCVSPLRASYSNVRSSPVPMLRICTRSYLDLMRQIVDRRAIPRPPVAAPQQWLGENDLLPVRAATLEP